MLEQRFQLRAATMAVTEQTGKSTTFMLPAGAEVIVFEELRTDPLDAQKVVVRWDGRLFRMFLTDLQERGKRIIAAREFNRYPEPKVKP